MEVVLIILMLIGSGYFLKILNILKEEDRVTLNNIVIYLTMPSTIFLTILKHAKQAELLNFLKLPVALFLTNLLIALIVYYLGKLLKLDKKLLGSLILVSMLGNTGFLGYPVVLEMFGDEGLLRAIFCDMGGVFATMLLGTYVGISFGENKGSVIKELLKFPPLITMAFSVLLVYFGFNLSYLPEFILKFLKYLSSATVPLIMMSLGLSLSPSALKFGVKYGLVASFFRFIFSPMLALALSFLFNIQGLERNVLLVESSMPSAMMCLVLGTLYKLDVKAIASSIFITTTLSLLVIAFWSFLFS
ncbi:Auxin Efflux Carrier [Methanocaldococcus infernus ME]|uniref:Auxin Efflux Carrier n=1 Tax=Methanocaldococcus infernus (strain DSM 11812 / JCM 15783 / ME) TaxID=573063 RepID=D5VSF0_METIM|nr:AEC family transporter [Methanocaldococcus infernus]ADG13503.1 Auxin Efflux Carrier [Methanocaldococcus infernus ME]